MKLMLISGSHDIYGGGQVYLRELSKELSNLGHECIILSSDSVFENAVRIKRIDSWGKKLKNILYVIKCMDKIDPKREYKIILNDITLSMCSFLFFISGWRVLSLVHMSINNTARESKVIKLIYPIIRAKLIRLGSNKILSVNSENASVLGPKSIYVGNFTVSNFDSQSNSYVRDIDYLFVGRLEVEKQPIEFVKLISNLKSRQRNIKSVMIGSGNLFDDVKREIEKNDLSNEISMTGFLKHNEIIEFYKRAKYIVITSRTEGLPTVILDASCYGVDFISTPVGSLPFLCNKYKVGHLFLLDEMVDGVLSIDKDFYYYDRLEFFSREHNIKNVVAGIGKEIESC
ncbi:glycosyltransferase family 4 protein [Edwardsiella tarda]